MKLHKIICLVVISIVVLSGCISKTIEEEFSKTHLKNGQEILYKGSFEQRSFILYKAPFDNGKVGVGVAIFKGNDRDGWKQLSSNSMYHETKMIIDSVGIDFADGIRKYLIYGTINDPEISKIEITDKYSKIVEGTIIETNWKRIWYGLVEMDELKLKVYNQKNEIITEVPSSPIGLMH
jgi:hypothetical protein